MAQRREPTVEEMGRELQFFEQRAQQLRRSLNAYHNSPVFLPPSSTAIVDPTDPSAYTTLTTSDHYQLAPSTLPALIPVDRRMTSRSNSNGVPIRPFLQPPAPNSREIRSDSKRRKTFSHQRPPGYMAARTLSSSMIESRTTPSHAISLNLSPIETHTSFNTPTSNPTATPDVGEAPDAYLARLFSAESAGPSQAPFSYPVSGYIPPATPSFAYSHSFASPTCPSMVSWSSTADDTPMSRGPSALDNSVIDAFEMARLNSTKSVHEHAPGNSDPGAIYRLSIPPKRSSDGEELVAHTGAALSLPSGPLPAKPLTEPLSIPSHTQSTPMERSSSNSSSKSTSSVSARAKEAHQRVMANSKKLIAPKPGDTSPTRSGTHSNQSSKHEKASTATMDTPNLPKKEGKTRIPKVNYQRPTYPRVYCDRCQEYPNGFRGEHELRRHTLAKHNGRVKKYVCRDANADGLHTAVEIRFPLSQCKACRSLKQYGAYYNAAAHLRRTHFKPKKARTKRSRTGTNEPREKRGGSGGGDWPSMEELRPWFKEVYVDIDPDAEDYDNSDDDEAEADDTFPDNLPTEFMADGDNLDFPLDMPLDLATASQFSYDTNSLTPTPSLDTHHVLSDVGLTVGDAVTDAMYAWSHPFDSFDA